MALSEFDLIRNYFSGAGCVRDDVSLGVGDDCALVQVPRGFELAVSIDTLVEGVHFFPGADPESLGFVTPAGESTVKLEITSSACDFSLPLNSK